jgi:hypothetical protein
MLASAMSDRSRQVSIKSAWRVRSRQMMRTCWRVRWRRNTRAQLIIGLRLLHSGSNLPTQLTRREVTVQLTEARQLQQHQRVT